MNNAEGHNSYRLELRGPAERKRHQILKSDNERKSLTVLRKRGHASYFLIMSTDTLPIIFPFGLI